MVYSRDDILDNERHAGEGEWLEYFCRVAEIRASKTVGVSSRIAACS